MFSIVMFQFCFLVELHKAFRTSVVILIIMLLLVMMSQLRVCFASILTEFAFEWFDSGVSDKVSTQSALLCESFVTQIAFIRFDSFVNHHMNVKSVLSVEEFCAVFERTVESVQMLVNEVWFGALNVFKYIFYCFKLDFSQHLKYYYYFLLQNFIYLMNLDQ